MACFIELFVNKETHIMEKVFVYLVLGFVGLLGFILSYAARRFLYRFQCFMDVVWLKNSVQYVTMLMGCIVLIAFQSEDTKHYLVSAVSIVSLYLGIHAFLSPINIRLGTFCLVDGNDTCCINE